MELDITWKRTARIWWSYFWRSLLALLGAVILSALIGAIVGFILGILGYSKESIQLISALIGFISGILVSIIPIKLILGKDYGEFRLVLIANQPAEAQ